MDVMVDKRSVRLLDSDFVSSGGEGKVYAKHGVAFKIYLDKSKVLPLQKLKELAVLERDNIIRPLLPVAIKGTYMGYTMRFLKDTSALCQAFTKSFKARNGLTGDRILSLVLQMREGVSFCHSKGTLIVDLNEFNFLLDKNLDKLYHIDVDSYQTPNFPATAIMDSIRDRHAKSWSELTDWFSFAIVSFQLFVGIHPYKGTHPKIKGLDERMRNNASVFGKDVSIPPSCEKLDVIPEVFYRWYEAVFERGERSNPPKSAIAKAVVATKEVMAAGQFRITKIKSYDSPIRKVWVVPQIDDYVVLAGDEMIWEKFQTIVMSGAVPFTAGGEDIIAWIQDGKVMLMRASTKEIRSTPLGANMISSDGRFLLVKNGPKVVWVDVGPNLSAMPRKTFGVMENATKMFDSLVIQDMIGACHVSWHQGGKMYQYRIKELDGHDVINAKECGGYATIVSRKGPKMYRYCCKLDGGELVPWKFEETDNSEINCAVKTVSPSILASYDQGDLTLAGCLGGKWSEKKFKNLDLGGGALVSGAKVRLFIGNDLYEIESKVS